MYILVPYISSFSFNFLLIWLLNLHDLATSPSPQIHVIFAIVW